MAKTQQSKRIVCDACGEESCLAGVMYCEDYKTAGTRVKYVGIEVPDDYDGPYSGYR